MDTAVLIICAVSFLWWAELAFEWWLAGRAGLDLADQDPSQGKTSLSVIVPARNEEASIEKALGSLLAALPEGGQAPGGPEEVSGQIGLTAP